MKNNRVILKAPLLIGLESYASLRFYKLTLFPMHLGRMYTRGAANETSSFVATSPVPGRGIVDPIDLLAGAEAGQFTYLF
jgi:hypothetical protein